MGDTDLEIQKLLSGEVVEVNVDKHVTSTDEGYVPIVKRTVCYIVMAFVFDDKGRILLIQEAKSSCRGQWYLPAGRVEPGENLIDAVKREAFEEAGVEIEPLTVCYIETFGCLQWFRVCYVGKVTGGKLKTLAEQDKESMQAQWFPVDEVLNCRINLRVQDFFNTLKLARDYLAKSDTCRHPLYQIGVQAHKHLLVRPVILKQTSPRNIEVLCCMKSDKPGLPCYQLDHREPSFNRSLNYLFQHAFNQQSLSPTLFITCDGLLTVEHCGIPAREHDGICFTPVCRLPEHLNETFETVTNSGYMWHKITTPEVIDELIRRTVTKNLLIPLQA